ncbi:MAG: helicase-exonuclease AddAB subunit AddB [Peptococcaceae bacterium]|nr:helicase-exonuclease AddAB subunit AddB [Peptococcaceae bacterium]
MSLRFVYGRAGSGKTRYCLEEIKSRIAGGAQEPLVLLVPEQYTFQGEKDLITLLETGGILKTEVLSFRRIAYRIFHQVGGITYPHIHSAGKSMIIYRILDVFKNEIKVFSKSADRQGFVSTISELITELKQHNISPQSLEKAVDSLQQDNPLREKIQELNLIYINYEKMISEKYRDADDDLSLAAKKLTSSTIYDGAEIWVDGFSGFTPQEYTLIKMLLTKAKRVTISLCTDNLPGIESKQDSDIFSSVKNVYRNLIKNAKELGIKVESEVFLGEGLLRRFNASSELAHLERNINAYPYEVYIGKTEDICLASFASMFSEVDSAAREIVRLCRDEGMHYRDIGVAARNLEAYEATIEAVFSEYEIPYFIDSKIDLVNNPLVKLIRSMLDIFIDNWSYEAVFRYLKSGLTGIERDRIDKLENYVLACGIRSTQWNSEQDWDMLPGFNGGGYFFLDKDRELKEINQTRYDISGPLQEFRKKTKGGVKTVDMCTELYSFLCSIQVPEQIEKIIEKFKEESRISLANEYSQVWNIVIQLFDQIVEVMGEEACGVERFAKVLNIGLEEYKVGLIPPSLDQVLVGSIERSKSHEVKGLLIFGVNDGIFPSAIPQEGILTDYERAALDNLGIELASDTRSRAFEEQYLVYKALTTPGRYLRLSWLTSDCDGRAMRPSIIISRMKKLFPAINERSDILNDSDREPMELISREIPAFKHMAVSLRETKGNKNAADFWGEVFNWFAAKEGWSDKSKLLRDALEAKNIAYPISKEKTRLLYGQPVYSSVSKLEKYQSCSFAYYVQFGLGARERKIYSLSPPDIGTFLHEAIEKFSLELLKEELAWENINPEWCQEKIAQIVDEMIGKIKGAGYSSSKRHRIILSRLKRVIVRSALLISEHMRRGNFLPVGYEVGFGEKHEFPPVIVSLDSGEQVYLNGRIDRVDLLKSKEGSYLRIVDYKLSKKEFKLSDVYNGLQIQLLTYFDAIWESNRYAEPVIPGGLLYFTLDDPVVRENTKKTREQIEESIMKTLRMEGLLLADVDLIRQMDKDLEGSSLIIPARINKGNTLGKSSVVSLEQFHQLRRHVRELLKGLCEDIFLGDVSINPYRKTKITSCTYCLYSSICQFDSLRQENKFRILTDLKESEIWDRIKNGGIQDED